jgi:hypothetical protein
MAISGKYYAHIGKGDKEMTIPIIISGKPDDLYNACSPLHEFQSSLTFEPGQPIEHDVHGAEATIRGYIHRGTNVAYIPENLVYEGRFSKPPWAARMFIHRGKSDRGGTSWIPQPVYSFDRVLGQILMDGVDYILFHMSDASSYASCTSTYDGIFTDLTIRRPILKTQLYDIDKYWGTTQFAKRVKD